MGGSLVTSYGRITLHEKALFNNKTKNLYCDTDSVIAIYGRNQIKPEIGPHLGQMTDEIIDQYGDDAECVGFRSTGCKRYSLKIKKGDKFLYQIKVKGLSLSNATESIINFQTLDQCIRIPEKKISLKSTRFNIQRGIGIRTNENYVKTFKFTYNKRAIVNHTTYETIPWGSRSSSSYYVNNIIDNNVYKNK